MNLHPVMAEALAPFAPADSMVRVPNTLGALTAHAYAAGLRLSDAYREGTEAEIRALEQAADQAHTRVRAKLAEMQVDPHMLRVVLA